MAAQYQALFDGIGKQGESTRTGGRTKNESNRGKGHGNGAVKSWQRDGDWLCPNTGCQNINFAFRGVCNRCRATRHADASGTSAGNGGLGCGMRPGGRANTTAIGKRDLQTVRVEMSVDDWKKWQQFKRMYMTEKSSMEAPLTSASSNPTDSRGNVSKFMNNNQSFVPWLIDSGASRHMVGSYHEFSKYAPSGKEQGVQLADGSTQAIMGTGTVECGHDMSLSSVLHVPSFPINLLSISCITKELNCAAIFYPTWCVFLELGTWKVLGTGIMRDGLYYLDDDTTPVAATVLSQSPLQEFMLLHRRLGHMPFRTLDLDNETGGDKGEEEDSDVISQEMIIGVIPRDNVQDDRDVIDPEQEVVQEEQQGDRDVIDAEQEVVQEEQQEESNDVSRWPKPNEEREVRVYTRRQRIEEKRVQEQEHGETHSSDSHTSDSFDGDDEPEITRLKKALAKSFEVKDLGFLHYFLGIEVAYGAQAPKGLVCRKVACWTPIILTI